MKWIDVIMLHQSQVCDKDENRKLGNDFAKD